MLSAKRLLLLSYCLIYIFQKGAIAELQLSGRQLNASSCVKDDQCDTTQFCLRPALGSGTGSCTSCWRCCLFPEVYGACPDACNCNVGSFCESRDGCGSGLFCSVEDPWEAPMCQPCQRCTSNSYELLGSCAHACASADMAGRADLPHLSAQHFLFLAFLAHDISQQGASVPAVLLASELYQWAAAQGLSGAQANMTVTRLMGSSSWADAGAGGAEGEEEAAVATTDWMQRVSATTSLELLCPAYDPALPWTDQPAVVSEGCFCNATRSAGSFRCPAGSRCSRAALRWLDSDAPVAPTAAALRALCVACEAGQHCPQGTYVQNDTDLSSLDCPAGFYCPSPALKLVCPAGAFCAARSTEPITCNYETLLLKQPYQELPMEPETVVRRLRDKRDPMRGNFCPAQSVKPYSVCSAGYYCPNVSSMLPCPRGHFCKAQSTAPWKCSWLTHCPEGTAVPALSFMALVIAAVIVCGIPLIYLFLTHLDNSVIMDADDEGARGRHSHAAAATRMTHRLLKSIKLPHSPLETKYRGFRQVSPPITMEFESLGLQLRPRGFGESANKKVVLQGVSGSFSPRRLNAILGPSGCGKTTFLNVLCGKISNGQIMGQVRINGEDMPVTRLKKIMGFVPQDDIVHEDLTVRENLNYSARLRLPSDVKRRRRRDIVHDALEMLGLTAIQHYRVGTVERRGISGGQRKRVNIGLELVAVPSLLFLDEPTSGLDATSSADILSSLGDMANLGMNIIMVIHQPRFSSFLMFDQVLLLGTGGRTVYLGSPSAAMLYFTKYLGYRFPERENPSDILMDIIAGKLPCAEDPKLKTCSQLVDKWTSGGMAWVETLETLNPTMVTKMSDVDPTILLAIDEEFELLNEGGKGQINPGQLVKLFSALGQDISLEDAIILIRKLNANRPASAKSGMTSASTTGPLNTEEAEGLTVTKQQLLEAFQGVREGNGDAPGEGGPQRSAAAKFYASQFLLPDLPEVKDYREEMQLEMTRKRRKAREPQPGGGYKPSPRGRFNSHRSSPRSTPRGGHRDVIVLANSSAGGSSGYSDSDHLESDSYSPVRLSSPKFTFSPKGTGSGGVAPAGSVAGTASGACTPLGATAASGGGAGAGVNPLVENFFKRSTLSPGRGDSDGGVGGGANRAVRTMARPPGLATANGSGTTVSAIATDESDGGASANLTAYAALRRAEQGAQSVRVPPEIGSHGGGETETDGEGQSVRRTAGGGYEACREDGLDDDSYNYYADIGECGNGAGNGDEDELSVAPGLVATSLAAMEALARADVPLPQLPRRVADTRIGDGRPCRSQRRSTTYNAIEAYVTTYNRMAAAAAAAGSSGGGGSGGGGGGGGSIRAASLSHGSVAAATAAARRASVKASRAAGLVSRRSGGPSMGEGDMWVRRAGSASVVEDAGAAVPSPARLRRTAEDEGTGDSTGGDGGGGDSSRTTPALPPLLMQLVGFSSSGGGSAAAGRASVSVPGPVAEGTETEATAIDVTAAAVSDDAVVLTPYSMGEAAWIGNGGGGGGGRTRPVPIPLPPLPPPTLQPIWVHRKALNHSKSSPLNSDDEERRSDGGNYRTSAEHVSGGGAAPCSSPPLGSSPTHTLGGATPGSGSPKSLATTSANIMQYGDRRTPVSRLAVMTSAVPPSPEAPPPPAAAEAAAAAAPPPADPLPLYEPYFSDGGSAGGAARSPGRLGMGIISGSADRLPLMRDTAASSPLPKFDPEGSTTGGGAGTSAGGGRKPRRHSLVQASFDGPECSDGGTRKQKKDTLYVNSLLSNALVGAWAATQSVSTVRSTQSAARLVRPGAAGHASSGGGGHPSATAPGCLASSGGHPYLHASLTSPSKATTPGGRSGAVARSMASMTALGLASKAPSSTGGGLHGHLAARLAMEEALMARKSQGFLAQLAFLLRRACVKYVRSFWPMRVVDTLLQLAAALVIGLVHGTHWSLSSVPSNAVMCMVCLGVLSCVTHLRTFSHNRVLLWREAASGMSLLAHYLSQNVIDQLWVFTAPALSLGVYYYLTLPRMPFSEFYVVGLFVCWWASGMAYLVSAVLPPQNVLMAGVFISLIFGAFLHGLSPTIASARGTLLEGVLGVSYNRWAMEIVSINELKHYQEDMSNVIIMMAKGIGLCGVDQLLLDDGNDDISAQEAISFLRVQQDFTMEYCDRYKSVAYGSLVALGLGFRLVAFLFLRYNCVTRH